MFDIDRLNFKKLYLLDMDGTIYLGDRLFDFTLPFLDYITKTGAEYIFFTNNSSKSKTQYLDKLKKMNVPVKPENLITSTMATVRYLKAQYKTKPIYASGTSTFVQELTESGLNIVNEINTDNEFNTVNEINVYITALVMGFDTELTFQKLENMCILLGKEVDYIATNPDLVCPTEYGYIPDCGSVAIMLKNATGKEPAYIGKPMPYMIEMALEQTGISKDEAIIIGDRLYTDIACGINAGIESALVLSGESKVEDLQNTPNKPSYIFRDLGHLQSFI